MLVALDNIHSSQHALMGRLFALIYLSKDGSPTFIVSTWSCVHSYNMC